MGFTHQFTLYCINLTIFLHFCTFQQCISCEIGNLSMMFYSSSHSSTTRDFWQVKHHTEIASSQDIYNTAMLAQSAQKQRGTIFIWIFLVQVNNYEIVVNFFHISHNLTWYSAIVHKFTRIYPVCSTYELTKQFM